MDGVELDFEAEAIDLIAQKAIKRKTGARALKSIVEGLMLDIMYDIPSDDTIKKFTITKAMVEEASAEDNKNAPFWCVFSSFLRLFIDFFPKS